jgi:hypothetical protein
VDAGVYRFVACGNGETDAGELQSVGAYGLTLVSRAYKNYAFSRNKQMRRNPHAAGIRYLNYVLHGQGSLDESFWNASSNGAILNDQAHGTPSQLARVVV